MAISPWLPSPMSGGTILQTKRFGEMSMIRPFSSTSSASPKPHFHYPIVIVGGGPCGLFLASLLQRFGGVGGGRSSKNQPINHHHDHSNHSWCLLDAQHPEDHWTHPQAHFLNTRTMELLKRFFPSTVYPQVQDAMPPVSEWNTFSFGTSMFLSSSSSTSSEQRHQQHMATVQHPVHVPLVAGADANGKLLQTNEGMTVTFPADSPDAVPLSDCTVGHLGQHVFHKILYNHLVEAVTPSPNKNEGQEARPNRDEASPPPLYFGSKVIHAVHDKDTGNWTITTDAGHVFTTPLVVACDGARSTWRERYLGIPMTGQPVIQRLINVHFSLSQPVSSSPSSPSSQQDQRVLPPSMLYTIFSSKVLAMVVRHSPTEYVMQVPFFPPYQTVEEDFSLSQVTEMVRAALVGLTDDDGDIDEAVPFNIHSIRPWSMGSLVAESYSQNNVYLVGDAAHVFPPAGGFGMNTGLQDALALVWRLYYQLSCGDGNRSSSSSCLLNPAHIYNRERQAVAYRNAALSVRNYNRVLEVMKSCYLDERNLPLLFSSLEASAKLGVPLSWQKATFRRLFQTALLPLSILKDHPSSPYSKRVMQNLRQLLLSGQGLPLLFPGNELGFSYPTLYSSNSRSHPSSSSVESQTKWENDSFASPNPVLQAGHLMPHIPCRQVDILASTRTMTKMPTTPLPTASDFVLAAAAPVTTTRDLSCPIGHPGETMAVCVVTVSGSEQDERPAPSGTRRAANQVH